MSVLKGWCTVLDSSSANIHNLYDSSKEIYELGMKKASIQQKNQVELALNCFYATILYGKYHICGTQMPNIRDFGSEENIVTLHSEIKRTASPPALPRREGAGRRKANQVTSNKIKENIQSPISRIGFLPTGEGGGRGRGLN